MRRKVVILTDSTADLSEELKSEYSIYTIPLYVRFHEEIYKDGVTLNTEELYQKVKEKKELPQTSAASPGDFIAFFDYFLNKDLDIVYIGIGSKLSATYQSAMLAKDDLDAKQRVHIVDSKNLSSGIALLVMKAKDLRDRGFNAIHIKERVEAMVPYVRSYFAIATFEYLYKGGRASALSAIMGSMLTIKPIIYVSDGKLVVYKKAFGKMSRALDMMIDDYMNEDVDPDYVFITHSLANRQALYMKNKLNLSYKIPSHLYEQHAGCVISSHCGQGTIGLLYMVKP